MLYWCECLFITADGIMQWNYNPKRKIPRNVGDISNKMVSINFQWIDFDSFFFDHVLSSRWHAVYVLWPRNACTMVQIYWSYWLVHSPGLLLKSTNPCQKYSKHLGFKFLWKIYELLIFSFINSRDRDWKHYPRYKSKRPFDLRSY